MPAPDMHFHPIGHRSTLALAAAPAAAGDSQANPAQEPDTAAAIGFRVVDWADADTARDLAAQAIASHAGSEVIRSPHLHERWAQRAASATGLVASVRALLGQVVAIEHSFGMIKWPGQSFVVPWHQDGLDEHLQLDPAHALSAWLALTDAPIEAGCLQVLPGSHRQGYRRHHPESSPGAGRGRAGEIPDLDARAAVPVPLRAGQALVFDVALIHSSPTNHAGFARLGLNVRYVAPGGIVRGDPRKPQPIPIRDGWSTFRTPTGGTT
jgi:ectoine hydroxylase-related dioxygenase (phytanoyl-CoA dioxygenase family)